MSKKKIKSKPKVKASKKKKLSVSMPAQKNMGAI
jgi:hypothetical protein